MLSSISSSYIVYLEGNILSPPRFGSIIACKSLCAVSIDLSLDVVLGSGEEEVELINVEDGAESVEINDKIGIGYWKDVGAVGEMSARNLELAVEWDIRWFGDI